MPDAASLFPRIAHHIAHDSDVERFVDERRGVILMRNATGEGTMQFYEVLPGITLAYSDFHMSACAADLVDQSDLLVIDHCREGRMEQLLADGSVAYLTPGDLKIDARRGRASRFVMPLAHYHGITVAFQLPTAQHTVDETLGGFPVDLAGIRERFCGAGADPFIMRSAPGIDHVFSELYHVPPQMREPYCKLKVLELLLVLQTLEPDDRQRETRRYFQRSQVERVKEAHDAMLADLSRTRTVEALARNAGVPLTAFKACFKGIYGMAPAAFLRAYRMERAAQLLRTTTDTVAAIGVSVGYDSPSKFSAAFKAELGKTPSEYRRGAANASARRPRSQ